MKKEKSCGVVVVRDGKILLVHQLNDFWSFPKGHVEPNETEVETAKREVFEETGLEVEVDETKRFTLNYIIDELDIDKDVVLFVGEVVDGKGFKKQDLEIAEMRWVPVGEVEKYFSREAWQRVWREIKETVFDNQN